MAERRELDKRSNAVAHRMLEPLGPKQRETFLSSLAEIERLLQASMVRFDVEAPRTATSRWCDEAAVLASSIGMLPSASLGLGSEQHAVRGLYEPIHGPAPNIAGQGRANPLGAIASAALLLRHSLGLEAEARSIDDAVDQCVVDGVVTADLAPDGAAATTMMVATHIADVVAGRVTARRVAGDAT